MQSKKASKKQQILETVQLNWLKLGPSAVHWQLKYTNLSTVVDFCIQNYKLKRIELLVLVDRRKKPVNSAWIDLKSPKQSNKQKY